MFPLHPIQLGQMTEDEQTLIAFDFYGTLVSTESVSKVLSEMLGSQEKGAQLAASWRKYQLEYSWRLTAMGCYDSFLDITRNSLTHALSEGDVQLEETQINQVTDQYEYLPAFPDAKPGLRLIADKPHIKIAIFTNGTEDMVANCLEHCQGLGLYILFLENLVTTEEIEKYKPAPECYQHLAEKMNKRMEDIWLVTANPFDVVGATSCGVKVGWVDRANKGWQDAAVPALRPRIIGKSLDEVVKAIVEEIEQTKPI